MTSNITCPDCGAAFSRNDALARHRKKGICTEPGRRRRGRAKGHAATAKTADGVDEEYYEEDGDGPEEEEVSDEEGVIGHEDGLLALAAVVVDSHANPLAALYPTIPEYLLPPLPVVEALLDLHRQFDGASHSFLHPETFRRRVVAGLAPPGILSAIIWSALRHIDAEDPFFVPFAAHLLDPAYREAWQNYCLSWLDQESRHLRSDPMADLERLSDLARATTLIRYNVLALGYPDLHNRYRMELNVLFPRLLFGQLESDLAERPRDPTLWIREEERSRLCGFIILSDLLISEVMDQSPRLVDWDKCRVDPSTGRYIAQWANMRAPCPDTFFESIDPDWHEIPEGYPAVPTYPLGFYCSWMDLPRHSPEREAFLSDRITNLLDHGYTTAIIILSSTSGRMGRFKRTFAERGYLLCYPAPAGDKEAGLLRETAAGCLQDLWAHLDPKVAEMDTVGDGTGLRELASAAWGPHRGHRLLQILVAFHTLSLILNSPYDIIDSWAYDEITRPTDAELEAWPSSTAFVDACMHAVSVSRLVRSGIVAARTDLRALPPMWVEQVIRACWVHAVAIRKIGKLLAEGQVSEASEELASEALNGLLSDLEGAALGVAEIGSVWKHVGRAIETFTAMVSKNEGNGSVWVKLTEEESGLLKGKGRSGFG